MPTVTLTAFAIPLDGFMGVFDHTYVVSSDGTRYKCFGRDQGGRVLAEGFGIDDHANCHAHSDSDAGIYYGVTGVCHQATNRIMASTGKIIATSSRLEPGSELFLCASYFFTTYGLPWDSESFGGPKPSFVEDWPDREHRCGLPDPGQFPRSPAQPSVRMKVRPYTSFLRKQARDQWKQLKGRIWTREAIRQRLKSEIIALMQYRLIRDKVVKNAPVLLDEANRAYDNKTDLVRSLIAGRLTHQEYLEQLNRLVEESMASIGNRITPTDYLDLFQIKVERKVKLADERVESTPPATKEG